MELRIGIRVCERVRGEVVGTVDRRKFVGVVASSGRAWAYERALHQ
jgi:hypothetical protein